MSLRWKVALSLAAIAALATIAIGTVSYRTTRERLLAEVDRSLVEVEQRVARTATRPGGSLERGPLASMDAQVVDSSGAVRQSTFPDPIPVSADDLELIAAGRGERVGSIESNGVSYRVRTVASPRGAVQIGRSLDDVDRVLADLRSRIVRWSLVVGLVASALGWAIASRITASLRRLTDAADHVEATGGFDVDLDVDGTDEVGRLGAAFDRMLTALARSRDEQRRLVQDAGHELRTPLTSLRTNLEALQRYPQMSTADRDAILADLDAETEELTTLVDEIVAVASGAASDEPPVTLDLAGLARDLGERYERRTGRSIQVSGDSPPVEGQRAAVQRAVSCLLDNANKFDPSGAPIDVVVSDATVVVADRGPGIAVGDLDHVFERFYRAEEARSRPGSGLGLSIVDAVARRHGGAPFARARDGGGAEVGFSLGTPIG